MTVAVTMDVSAAGIEEPFHVMYRHIDTSSDADSLSGTLILNIYNTSGEDARDIVAMVPGPNNVTYDNRHIFIGTLNDGQQVEILERFVVPHDLGDAASLQDEVGWQLEFTNTLGARTTLEVVGHRVE